MKNGMLIGLLSVTSSVCLANSWDIKGVSVEDVLVYRDNGYNVMTVDFSSESPANTGCTPTDEHKIASTWGSNPFGSLQQSMMSVLLSAQAQGLAVDLMVNTSNCSTGGQWDTYISPTGLGIELKGVRISSD